MLTEGNSKRRYICILKIVPFSGGLTILILAVFGCQNDAFSGSLSDTGFIMLDYLTTRKPEEMSLSAYKKHAKRQGAELLCNTIDEVVSLALMAAESSWGSSMIVPRQGSSASWRFCMLFTGRKWYFFRLSSRQIVHESRLLKGTWKVIVLASENS